MSVTGGSLDSKNTTLDVKKGDIESTTTEIVDEDIPLLLGLSGTETVGNGSSGGLVDDTENVKTGDSTGVLGGLTLVVVEVSGHGNDSLLNLLAELDLSDLLHLYDCQLGSADTKTHLVPCQEPWKRSPGGRKSWSLRGTRPGPWGCHPGR